MLKEKFKDFTTKVMVTATLLSASVAPVHADDGGDGGLNDAIQTFQPVLSKLGRPISMVTHIAMVALAIWCIIKGVVNFIQSKAEENPNDAQTKQKAAINNFIAAAVAVAGVALINVVLGLLGLDTAIDFFKSE